MTATGDSIARRLAALLEDMREHERNQPAETEAIVGSLVSHLRSWRPESVSPLGVLPAPEMPIRDPRTP